MNLLPPTFVAITALTASLSSITNAACETNSGPNTAALIELYTSEGCSSCPPADRQLTRLPQVLDPTAQVVPLALHVGYWDSLGWVDPYAQDRFAQRQTWLVQLNGHRTVYTPQFFVGGNEIQASHGSLREAVRQLNTMPAAATIRLQSALSVDGILTLDVKATTQKTHDHPTAVHLAIAENGVLSKVTAGENRNATLRHDHLVREWIGPIRLHSNTARARREIMLPATWRQDSLEIIAFVQDEHTGAVLQALHAGLCTRA
jgi:hypothetical protein